MHEAKQVLVGIAEAHAASHARLVVGGGTGHVERDHALVLVPDVDHAVELFVAGIDAVGGQQFGPVGVELLQGGFDLFDGGETAEQLMGRLLVDDADLGRIVRILPFLVLGHFDIAQHEHERCGFARLEFQTHAVGGDREPAVRHGIVSLAFGDDLRGVPAVELAEELVAAGVETDDGRVDAVERVMVAALLEFGLVVQQRGIGFAFDLHLAGGQVALEVGRVVHGIPQAPFHGAGHVDDGRLVGGVRHVEPIDFRIGVQRHEGGELGFDASLGSFEHGVADALTALVGIKRGLARKEGRRPGFDRLGIGGIGVHQAQVIAVGAVVCRHVVIPVAGDAA